MKRFKILFIITFVLTNPAGFSNTLVFGSSTSSMKYTPPDTLSGNQILYNGKIWRNLYTSVTGDQFLFTNEYLPGSVTIAHKTFNNIPLRYDIFMDELLTPADTGGVLQLNKEKVDSFSLSFLNRKYEFRRLKTDSLDKTELYYNVLYTGKTALYLKYSKKIDKLAVDGQYDKFYQFFRIYFVKNNEFIQISGKNDLLRAMDNERDLVKSFIKKNRLIVTEKDPESLIPVIRYFDSIGQ